MPSSKTETAIRYPEAKDQHRRLRHVTQDRKWEDRMRDHAKSIPQYPTDATSWGPETLLNLGIDQNGNPQPDPAQYRDGNKANRQGRVSRDQDMVSAANDLP